MSLRFHIYPLAQHPLNMRGWFEIEYMNALVADLFINVIPLQTLHDCMLQYCIFPDCIM